LNTDPMMLVGNCWRRAFISRTLPLKNRRAAAMRSSVLASSFWRAR
jgi:hypothetical protein